MTNIRASFFSRYFYLLMSLLAAAVIVYGFSHTVDQNLIHPTVPRPRLLYFHAALFTGWLAFFTLQSVLVRTRNVRIHRTIGWFGVAMGVSIPIVGVFDRYLGIPSVMMGFGLPDDNLHAPNEKFHLPHFYPSIKTVAHYLQL